MSTAVKSLLIFTAFIFIQGWAWDNGLGEAFMYLTLALAAIIALAIATKNRR